MKIRAGFVSNSSSASFTFIFKGRTVNDLCKAIEKHADKFEISSDFRNCDFNGVFPIETVTAKRLIKVLKGNTQGQLEPIDESIRGSRVNLKHWEKKKEKEKKEMGPGFMDFFPIENIEKSVSRLLELKKKGFESVYSIQFEDLTGNISTEELIVSAVMYDHREKFNFETDDLCCEA